MRRVGGGGGVYFFKGGKSRLVYINMKKKEVEGFEQSVSLPGLALRGSRPTHSGRPQNTGFGERVFGGEGADLLKSGMVSVTKLEWCF